MRVFAAVTLFVAFATVPFAPVLAENYNENSDVIEDIYNEVSTLWETDG